MSAESQPKYVQPKNIFKNVIGIKSLCFLMRAVISGKKYNVNEKNNQLIAKNTAKNGQIKTISVELL